MIQQLDPDSYSSPQKPKDLSILAKFKFLKEVQSENPPDTLNVTAKKSTFGKTRQNVSIDYGKIDVDLKNSSDQEALIKILQKETRKQREIQFIERAVRSLKFFQDKKQDLTEKIYLHLLEKLKYEFIEREKPLFFHGDKGDKYYIVLKGELALLLPSKPFEEKKAVDALALQRLKEKYYRVRDGELLMKSNTNELRPSTPSTPRLIKIVNERFKGPMARLRCMSSVAKRKSITESGPPSPMTNSPNAGNAAINLQKPSSNKSSGFSTPTKARLLLLNSQDFETEREREQTSFDLYISAFFPQLNLATFFTEGSAFGEIALLRKTERSGTVVSKEDSHLMILDKESFDEVLGSWERQKTDQQIQFLKSYPFFNEVNEKYLMGMLHSLEMKTLVRGEIICEENNFPEFLYLVKEGEVELSTECTVQTEQSDVQGIAVTELGRRSQKQIATVRLSLLTAGSSICEDSILLEQQTIGFQAKVCSTQAEIWLIDHSSFLQLLKQQRTFKRFQDHCQQNQDIRQRRIVKISATINSEASTHLKVTRYESKRHTAGPNLRPMTEYSKDSRLLDQMIQQQSQNLKEQQIQQEKQLLSKKKLKQITSKGNNQQQPAKQIKSNNEGKSQEQLLYFNNSKDCGDNSGRGSARDINVQEQQYQQQQQYPSQFSISNRSCSGVFSEERGQKSDRQERTISQEKGLNSERKYNKQDKDKICDYATSKEDTKPAGIEGDIPQATSVIQSRNANSSGQQQLLSLFSRSSDIERIHKTSLQKSNIFNQITKHSLVTQQQQQQLEEEIQHQKHINSSNNLSDKPQPFLPFQKNLLFQPRLGNGLLREPFIDPFNPVSNNEGKTACLSAREKPTDNAQLFRSVSFQKIAPISQGNLHEQHSHLGSPRSNFSTSINSVFSQLLKNQSVSAKNLTNFIDQTAANEQYHKQQQQLQHKQHNQSKIKQFECSQESTEQRRPSVPKILIKPQISTPYLEDGVLSPKEQQQLQKQAKKKVSIVDHFIDQSPIQRLFGASIPFRSSESLPTLIQLKSHQELENKGINNPNKMELQPISERHSQLLRKKPAFENAYHLYSSMKSPQNIKNSSSTTHLDGFPKQHEEVSLSQRRIISTVNLNASENVFDHMRVLSTEEDLSDEEEEEREKTEQKFAQSTMENTYNPLQKHRQSSSNLNRQEGTKNIHMEKLRLLNSKSLASLNSFTKAKQQFMNKSNGKEISINGNPVNNTGGSIEKNQAPQEQKNFNERTSKMSPKKQNITFTESIFYDANKPCVNSFFRPNPTLSRTLLNSSRSNSKNANNNCNNTQQASNNNNNSNTPHQNNLNSNSTETLRIHVGQATTSQDSLCSKGKSSSNSSRIKNSSQLTFQNSYFSKPSLTQMTTNKPTPHNTSNNNSTNGSKLFGL